MDIKKFSASNNENMAKRILTLREEKQWSANNFNTPKEIADELMKLNDKLSTKNMPKEYYSNIHNHITELKNKQKSDKSKKTDEKAIVSDGEFIKAMDDIDKKSKSLEEAYNKKCEYVKTIETDILSEDVLRYGLNEDSLPENPEFGVPEEKKYPLYDEHHVKSAIKLFGHVNPKYEEHLAHAIISRMRKYNIPFDMVGKDNKLYKYLPQSELHEEAETDKTSVLNAIRSDYQGELKAIKDYDVHADDCEKNGYADAADVLRDIRDEEKVHVGELQKILSKYDAEYDKSVNDGHKEAEETLKESVIDPVHDNLCQDLFDGEEMRSDVIDYILKAIMDWKQTVHFDKDFLAITCSGSLLTYQYNPTTDLDVHIYVESLSQEERDNVLKVVPKAVFIPNTNHPVEYTIMEFTPDHDKNAENLYDVLNRQWLRRKTKDEMGKQVPTDYITRISKFFMMAIDAALGQIDVHKAQLKNLQNMDVEESFSEEDKIKAIKEKCNDLIEDRDSIWFMVKMLRAFRATAYDNYKDRAIDASMLLGINFELSLPSDPHYSLNEMIFKTIERYGYKSKIDAAKNELDTLIASIENKEMPIVNGHEVISRDETVPDNTKLTEEDSVNIRRALPSKEVQISKGFAVTKDQRFDKDYMVAKGSKTIKNTLTPLILALINPFLFGIPAAIASVIRKNNNNERLTSDRYKNIQKIVDNDPKCQELLKKIAKELSSTEPDKKLLKHMREEFYIALRDARNKAVLSEDCISADDLDTLILEDSKAINDEDNVQSLTESVTFIDNAGNLKTMSTENYNKDMHEYHTNYEIKKFKLKKTIDYKLRDDIDKNK